MSRKLFVALPLVLVIGAAVDSPASFRKKLSKDQQILHALDRLAYGPAAGDIQRVKAIGVDKWIEQQLHAERIPENGALLKKLEPLETLRLDTAEMAAKYPLRTQQSKKGASKKGARPNLQEVLTSEELRTLRQSTSEERMAFLRSLPPAKRAQVIDAAGRLRQEMMSASPEVRREAMMQQSPRLVVAADLMEAKLQRAIYSSRQLEEVLVDFWFNHFNVYLNKGADRLLVTSYERDAIRPHVLGKFKDLVAATAKHPAMLFYLDNWQSVDPQAMERLSRRRRAKGAPLRTRGLNENYGRELLELHTLGVDGGYTQKDVIEVARCFTGWSIRNPRAGGAFYFNSLVHDRAEKTVLGQKIPAGGGIEDGHRVIELLAAHPSTARHVSTRLAQRFVADDPPKELVDRMAETFRKSGGDLREVMRTMVRSREFFSEGAYRAKLKSPLELVAAAARAFSADVNTALALARRMEELGQPLYRKEEPTGYSNNSEEWVNTAGLLGRMNFALALADGQVPGVRINLARFTGQDTETIARGLLGIEPTARTREAIAKGLEGKQATPALVAGLVIGSPDYQRR
jgi:uncharacterized protein (DUF1800 family)